MARVDFANKLNSSKNIFYINSTITEINPSAKKINYVVNNLGEKFQAKNYLIAAGSYSQALIDQLPLLNNVVPKLYFGSGTSLLLEHTNHNFKHVIRPPNRASACGAHIVSHDANIFYMGASNNIRNDVITKPKARDVYYLLQRAIKQFNQERHLILHIRDYLQQYEKDSHLITSSLYINNSKVDKTEIAEA